MSTKTIFNDDDLLTIQEFADYVGLKVNTIRKWRSECKLSLPQQYGGGRVIRYRKRDIDAWLIENPFIK